MPENNLKILQVHNRYQDLGGEDVVVAREKKMLEEGGNQVVQYIVSNKELSTILRRFKTALCLPYSFEHKRKLKRELQKYKPDVVHVHNFLPILTPSIFTACKEQGIPVILTLHNFRLLCSNGLLYRDEAICEKCITKKWALPAIQHGCYQESKLKSVFPVLSNGLHSSLDTWAKQIDKVIFLTEFSKEIFLRSHIRFKPSQIEIKPNFVEDYGFTYEKEDYFLFVGRLSLEKGILEVIAACIKNGTRLKVAGTGPLMDHIKKISLEHSYIECLGFQNTAQLQGLYLKAKALITASKMYETFGLVIIESFSYGTPVLTPQSGTASTIVTHGVNGICYDATEGDSLVTAINHIKMNVGTQFQMNARKTFENFFVKERNAQMLKNIYISSIEGT